VGGAIYALDDTCVHAGCSLSGGKLDGSSVICPCHGSQYDLQTGSVINGPATMPEPYYDVRVQNGTIEVKRAQA
jgi:nitrite reductase/ring-hydroxylating ferredoxin subunit